MSKIIDETGNKYGLLTVLDRGPNTKNGRAQWNCLCECGNKTLVLGSQLRNGKTKSCGCYQRKRTSETITSKNMIGKTIGNFTILESIPGNKQQNTRHRWRCRCNLCGNENAIVLTDCLKRQESCGCLVESKGARAIRNILEENNLSFIQEKSFSSCIFEDSKRPARFDFFVNNSYIIEYDGRQHFIQGNGNYDNKEKFKKTQEHDKIKTAWCKNNNIPLIRIPYTHFNHISLSDLIPETSAYLV